MRRILILLLFVILTACNGNGIRETANKEKLTDKIETYIVTVTNYMNSLGIPSKEKLSEIFIKTNELRKNYKEKTVDDIGLYQAEGREFNVKNYRVVVSLQVIQDMTNKLDNCRIKNCTELTVEIYKEHILTELSNIKNNIAQ